MIYVILAVGCIFLIYGSIQNKNKEAAKFSDILGQMAGTEELRLVNHTITEQELSDRLNEVLIELNNVKITAAQEARKLETIEAKLLMQAKANEIKKTTPETYKDVSQKLSSLKKSKSLDELSKEMEIGKGELQLLQNLQKK